jgi:hypothetical protein
MNCEVWPMDGELCFSMLVAGQAAKEQTNNMEVTAYLGMEVLYEESRPIDKLWKYKSKVSLT